MYITYNKTVSRFTITNNVGPAFNGPSVSRLTVTCNNGAGVLEAGSWKALKSKRKGTLRRQNVETEYHKNPVLGMYIKC
jgi:hypothetical protein